MLIKQQPKQIDMPKLREANVPHMFDSIKVVVGSEEGIFEETYLSAIVGNNRLVKFKKSAIHYK
jgi:hypothetical protein